MEVDSAVSASSAESSSDWSSRPLIRTALGGAPGAGRILEEGERAMKAHLRGGAEGGLRKGGIVARFLGPFLLRRAGRSDEEQGGFGVARGPDETRNRSRRRRRQGDEEEVFAGGGGEQVADAEHEEIARAGARDGLRRPPRPHPLQRTAGTHLRTPAGESPRSTVAAKPHRRCGSR